MAEAGAGVGAVEAPVGDQEGVSEAVAHGGVVGNSPRLEPEILELPVMVSRQNSTRDA